MNRKNWALLGLFSAPFRGMAGMITQNGAIVEAAVFAATAATLWWFGDRAPKPPMRRDG